MTADYILEWAVQTGLVVSLLILAILIIRKPFSRVFGAGPTYALWSLPVIRLCLPVIALPQNWVPNWLYSSDDVVPQTVATPETGASEISAGSNRIISTDVSTLGSTLQTNSLDLNWTAIGLGLWLGVAFFWIVLQLLRQRNFVNMLRQNSEVVDSKLGDEITQASKIVGLKRLPNIRISHENSGPFVTGLTRPMVILPAQFVEDYSAEQRQYALVHEFAHIKRGDLWVALGALIFKALNWFNPLIHYGVNKMRIDQEAACDDFVMRRTGASERDRFAYAKTLLHAAKIGGANTKSAQLALSLMEERAGKGRKEGDENA